MPPKCVRPAWLQAILKPRGDLLILAITSLKGRLRPDYHNCLGSAIYAARARLRDAECAGFRYYQQVSGLSSLKFRNPKQQRIGKSIRTSILSAIHLVMVLRTPTGDLLVPMVTTASELPLTGRCCLSAPYSP